MTLKNELRWEPSDQTVPMSRYQRGEHIGLLHGLIIFFVALICVIGTPATILAMITTEFKIFAFLVFIVLVILGATCLLFWINRKRIEEEVYVGKDMVRYRFSDIRGVEEWSAKRSDFLVITCEEVRSPPIIRYKLFIYLSTSNPKKKVLLFHAKRTSSYRNISEEVNQYMKSYGTLFGVPVSTFNRGV